VICATVALRVDLERQSQKVPSLYVDIMTHKGLVKAWTLDSRGEANFADQHWAKEHFPEVYPQKCMPLMATSYGWRPLAIRTGDSNDLKRENVHDFHAIDIGILTSIGAHGHGLTVKSSTLDRLKSLTLRNAKSFLPKAAWPMLLRHACYK